MLLFFLLFYYSFSQRDRMRCYVLAYVTRVSLISSEKSFFPVCFFPFFSSPLFYCENAICLLHDFDSLSCFRCLEFCVLCSLEFADPCIAIASNNTLQTWSRCGTFRNMLHKLFIVNKVWNCNALRNTFERLKIVGCIERGVCRLRSLLNVDVRHCLCCFIPYRNMIFFITVSSYLFSFCWRQAKRKTWWFHLGFTEKLQET